MTDATGLPRPRTPDELRDRLADAAATLRRVPAAKNSGPAGYRIAWPDYLQDRNEAYGYSAARGGRTHATAAEIARLDEVLVWISRWWSEAEMGRAGLPADAGQVAWLHGGAGWKWPRVAKRREVAWGGGRSAPGGNSAPSLRLIEERALAHMLRRLGGGAAVVEPVMQLGDLPAIRIDVTLDRTMTERVSAIRADGSAVVTVRHARATWGEVPDRRRRED